MNKFTASKSFLSELLNLIWDVESTWNCYPLVQVTVIVYLDYWNSHLTGLTASTSVPISSVPNTAAQAMWLTISQTVPLLSTKPHDDFSSYLEKKSKSFIPSSVTHSTSISYLPNFLFHFFTHSIPTTIATFFFLTHGGYTATFAQVFAGMPSPCQIYLP